MLGAQANNLPQMMASSYANQTYTGAGNALGLSNMVPPQGNVGQHQPRDFLIEAINEMVKTKENKMAEPKRRLVKVIIVDPDDKVPLEKCILYSGSEKLTDLTDQELFFEIEIKAMLDDHNKIRTKIIDKSVKERTEHLEPIKVRDLRMVVVTVAQF